MDLKTEQELAIKAKTDRAAFGKLYDFYYKKIFNYILRKSVSLETAQDLTADTFFSALEHIDSFQPQIGSHFGSWLYKIATNKVYEYFRSNGTKKFHCESEVAEFYEIPIPEAEIESAEAQLDACLDFRQIQTHLLQLDPKYRTIIELRFFEELDYEEISTITGINVGTLKSHLSRALEKLRGLMQPNLN